MKRLTFVFILLLFFKSLYPSPIDSLRLELQNASDVQKLPLFEELCTSYYSINLDSATFFAKEMLKTATELNSLQEIALANKLLGNVNYFTGDYTNAISFYKKAEEISQQNNYTEILASVVNNMGSIYRNLGNDTLALVSFEKVLKIDSINQNKGGIGSSLTNIGNVYIDRADYDIAIEYYNKALEISLELDDRTRTVSAYNNLGLAYHWKSDFENTSKYYHKALKIAEELNDNYSIVQIQLNLGSLYQEWEYFDEALKRFEYIKAICESNGDKPNLCKALENIGIIYNEKNKLDSAIINLNKALVLSKEIQSKNMEASINLNTGYSFELKKEYQLAEQYYQSAYEIRIENGNEDGISMAIKSLARINFLLKKYQEAEKYAKLSLDKAIYPVTKIESLKLLSDIYKASGKTDKAFSYYLKYTQLKDSIFTSEKHLQIQELQTKYETAKKEQQIVSLSKEKEIEVLKNKQSQFFIYVLILFLLVLITFTVFYIRNSKLKALNKSIQLEQKLFRSQMNPHFIFNAISSIQEYILKKNPLEAASYLSNFAKLMRSILTSSATEFIKLEEEIDTLENYLKLQKLRFPDKLEYEINVDDNLDTEEIKIPAMLSQPFIENSIKHGIEKKKDGGKVTVDFSMKNEKLQLKIEDTGAGYGNSLNKSKNGHQSMALKITENRLMNLEKIYKSNIQFESKNKVDKNGAVLGTETVFVLPIINITQK